MEAEKLDAFGTANRTPQRSILLLVNERGIPHALAAKHQLLAGEGLLLYSPISGG